MLMTKERRSPIRTLRGWAILVLQEAGAEEHGWTIAPIRTPASNRLFTNRTSWRTTCRLCSLPRRNRGRPWEEMRHDRRGGF
jgi:hypothetical protein